MSRLEPSIESLGISHEELNMRKIPVKKTKQVSKKDTEDQTLARDIREAKSAYNDFILMYPDYAFKSSVIKTRADLEDFLWTLDMQQKKQRLDFAINDLPMNFHYLNMFVSNNIGKRYAYHRQDQKLYEKWERFEDLLDKNFDTLEPVLIETIKKYPILQQCQPHVLIRLGMILHMLWGQAGIEEEMRQKPPKDIPEDF